MNDRKVLAFLGFQIIFRVGVQRDDDIATRRTVFLNFVSDCLVERFCLWEAEASVNKILLIVYNNEGLFIRLRLSIYL
ncbi:hypothetical protein A7X67_17135 [Clostridium sp. W14A]|nr:hypothetical protein A7X67_17135 [Clostridium sp. W14A]